MVQIVGLQDILAQHPFAEGLPPEILATISGCCSNAVDHPGDYIFREGEPADHFFLIRQGMVALEMHLPQGSPIVVETLESGDIFGWSWLVPPYRWTIDARAVELVRAIGIDAACLRGKCEADHDLGYEMMKRFMPIFVKRLHDTQLQILDVYGTR